MRSLFTIAALVVGALCIGVFALTVTRGLALESPRTQFVPAEVRAAPGGYRSFHFWHAGHGGYRGGK